MSPALKGIFKRHQPWKIVTWFFFHSDCWNIILTLDLNLNYFAQNLSLPFHWKRKNRPHLMFIWSPDCCFRTDLTFKKLLLLADTNLPCKVVYKPSKICSCCIMLWTLYVTVNLYVYLSSVWCTWAEQLIFVRCCIFVTFASSWWWFHSKTKKPGTEVLSCLYTVLE